ncbi:metallophosphoesterase family protein [Pandoraea sputorum]|uniref:metallophosphoesterase family protein n=1 Tax=Pandoraea sputorum TaxID=93222 RepID=UPI001242ABD7|nr:metallophosphoesterase [Pandoraea sputorum]VVE56095.1 hypothetical protein PSP20601_05039 [Pandoraea sputorum]
MDYVQFSFHKNAPRAARDGETLSGRKTDASLELASAALQEIHDTQLPAFTAQLKEGLESGPDLDSLQGCYETMRTLEQDLKDVNAQRTAHTYRLHTKGGDNEEVSEFAKVFVSLSNAATSLDQVRQELKEKKEQIDELAPGWATKMLKHLGTFLGVVVGACLFVSAFQLALPVAAALALGGAAATLAVVAGVAVKCAAAARLSDYDKYQADCAVQLRARADQIDSLRAMVIRAQRDMMIANIRDQLSPEAAEYHAQLLTLREVDQAGNEVSGAPGATTDLGPKVVMIGDGDGSDDRVLLAAIQSGHVSLNEKGQAILARRLQAEADFMQKGGENYKEYQENGTLRKSLVELYDCMKFQDGIDTLIFAGDLCHDRLSTNKDVSRTIREDLSLRGVVFLFGNHDDWRSMLDQNGRLCDSATFGTYAKNDATRETWQRHEAAVFANICYIPGVELIGTHQGMRAGPDGTIQTAWGFVAFTGNPMDLVEAIRNKRFLPIPTDARKLKLHHKIQLLLMLSRQGSATVNINRKQILDTLPGCTRTLRRWDDAQKDAMARWLATEEREGRLNSGVWQALLALHHSGMDQADYQTDFRPTIDENRALAEAYAEAGHPVTFFKGHDDSQASGKYLLSLNARVTKKTETKTEAEAETKIQIQPTAFAIRRPPTGEPVAQPIAKPLDNPWRALPRLHPAKIDKNEAKPDAHPALGGPGMPQHIDIPSN